MASCTFFPAINFLSSSSITAKSYQPFFYPRNPNSFEPKSAEFIKNGLLNFDRLRISYRREAKPKYAFRVSAVLGLGSGDSETCSGSETSSTDRVDSFPAESATIDLKLPRRRLMVQFSCNACGERTQRLINRLAYERGTVFLQCSGCQKHHKLIDNLGLVVEYDFRDEVSIDANAEDQV